MLFILFLNSCNTVEVTREIIKAGKSVQTSVSEIRKSEDEITKSQDESSKVEIEKEKEIIITEQKEQQSIVEAQQKSSEISFLGNSINEIMKKLNKPQLAREDGNSYMLRYDSKSCRLFLFFNLRSNNKIVEYFELRNSSGDLIERKEKIRECYIELELV
tara:strand:- start:166 stop:645 length:480 start_codon:yes stop_codon:yes gene_type:complete